MGRAGGRAALRCSCRAPQGVAQPPGRAASRASSFSFSSPFQFFALAALLAPMPAYSPVIALRGGSHPSPQARLSSAGREAAASWMWHLSVWKHLRRGAGDSGGEGRTAPVKGRRWRAGQPGCSLAELELALQLFGSCSKAISQG